MVLENTQTRDMILIVDDIEINRIVLEEILNETYDTISAENGEAAISLLKSGEILPSMILLDIMMPEMDGYETLELIKKNPKTEHIPVIFITAEDAKLNEAKGLSLGAVDFVSKPFSAEIIKARVATHLRLYHYSVKLEKMVQQKVNELLSSKEKMLEIMADIIEYRSFESGSHVKRTRDLTYILAKCLCENAKLDRAISESEVSIVAKAAPLHDIGKISIPDNVLLKNGKLTQDEYTVMKTHAMLGGEMVKLMMRDLTENDAYLECCYDITVYHHERWDGNGYPKGIAGESIPLSARILSLVDVYDALTTDRVYKEAMSHEEAVGIIKEGAGTQFDAKVVEAFLLVKDEFKKYINQHAKS